jgi:hypothetical protein
LAGVAEFDRRIEQAAEELKATGTKIDEQKYIMAEIISRLDILRLDRDQALKYTGVKRRKRS